MAIGWLVLGGAIILEVAGTTLLKLSNGFTVFWPSLGVVFCYTVALAGIAFALKDLELSMAYAIWSGAGTAITAAIGIAVFGETATALKWLSLTLIIAGIVGLNLVATSAASN